MATVYGSADLDAGERTTELSPQLAKPHRLPARHTRLFVAGALLFLVAVIFLLTFAFLAWDPATPRTVIGILLAVGLTILTLAGCCWLAGHVQRDTREMQQHVADLVAAEAQALRNEVRASAANCSAVIRQEIAALGAEISKHVDGLAGRIDGIERRMGELAGRMGEQYDSGWVDGAASTAQAMAPNGQVRQLRPTSFPAGQPSRPR
jgi:hypothetical protein